MDSEKKKFLQAFYPAASFLVLLWIIRITEELTKINLDIFGLRPHDWFGLIGILTAPLIHGSFNHLISNSLPLLFLTTGLLYFYENSGKQVFVLLYILPGIFVWFFGREAYHIGASGLVYGLASFIFFSGVIRRDTRSIALALLVTFLYGGMVWGVLPLDPAVSWEYHLFGAAWGLVLSFAYRKADPYIRYEWEEDDESDSDEKPEISYDDELFF